MLARRHGLTAALAAAVAVWTFPVLNYDVGDGLDPSWLTGLQMATGRHLAYGRAIVFTYGPLGALSSPVMAVPRLGLAAAWIRLLLQFAAAVLVLHRLRSAFGPVAAALLSVPIVWAAVTVMPGDGVVTLLILLIALGANELGASRDFPNWLPFAGGGLAAFALLWKFDIGLELLLLWALFVVVEAITGRWTWSRAAALVLWAYATTIASSVLLWVLLGQPIGALFDWVRTSIQLTRGYGAMVLDAGPAWLGPAAWLGAAGVALLLWGRIGDKPRRAQLANAAFVAAGLYLVARQGWTRQDGAHIARYSSLLVLLAAFLVVERSRGYFVLTAGLGVVMSLAIVGGSSLYFLHPGRSVQAVKGVFRITVSSAERRKHVEWGRRIQPTVMQVPQTMLDRVAGHTVHIDPWDASVAWAYPQMRWQPLPVFQSYLAYTNDLDRRNARALTSPDAPQFILSEPGSVDYRVPRFESPEAALALLCNYRLVEASSRWHLLERRPAPACGATRSLGAGHGKSTVVPPARPYELIVARIHMPGDGLRGLLLRPRPVTLQVSPGGPQQRFVVGTASGRHVLSIPACLRDDARSPGRLASFDTNPYGPLVFSRAAKVEFEAIPYRC